MSLVIEKGAIVHERQLIFRVVDLNSPMRVNAKVPESWVDRVQPGQQTRIQVDAFPGQVLTGKVLTVAPLPDAGPMANWAKTFYTTMVEIEKGPAGLRPGMTAQADILIKELDHVLSVPVEAVLEYDGKDRVAVKKPDGGIEWRVVTLGATNGKFVEVKQGLDSGESVVLNPITLLSEKEKRTKHISWPPPATRPASKKADTKK